MNKKEVSSLNNTFTKDRLIEIETKLAYQEDFLQILNDIVVQQREQIDVMQLKITKLSEQLGSSASDSQLAESFINNAKDELPPHY